MSTRSRSLKSAETSGEPTRSKFPPSLSSSANHTLITTLPRRWGRRSSASLKCWCAKRKRAGRSCRSVGAYTLATSIGSKDGAVNSASESRPASYRIIGIRTESEIRQTIATPHVKLAQRRFGARTVPHRQSVRQAAFDHVSRPESDLLRGCVCLLNYFYNQ